MLEPNYHSVLFTGGLDSTYRLCQLARDEKAVIQPIYIVFPDNGKSPHVRPELQKEIEAQDKILDYLVHHSNTKAKFLPIQRIQRDEILKDLQILELEYEIAEKYRIGWQYLYIAILAKNYSGIELCHENYPSYNLTNVLYFNHENNKYILDIEKTPKLACMIFKDVSWPIFGVHRWQMIENLKSWGFKDVLDKIIFCYHQINGKPCGYCDNCRTKIEQGLLFLFDKEAIHRFLVYNYIYFFYPRTSLPFFDLYMHKEILTVCYTTLCEWRDRKYYFRLFKEVDEQRDSTLMKEIISPSLKIGYFFKWGTKRIDDLKLNEERRNKFREIFKKIRKYKWGVL